MGITDVGKGIFGKILGFFRVFANSIIAIILGFKEAQEYRSVGRRRRIRVLMFDKFKLIDTFGQLDLSTRFLSLPAYNRIFEKHKTYIDVKGNDVVVVSPEYYRTINVNEMDSKKGGEATFFSERIMRSKLFEWLETMTRRERMITFIIGLIVGLLLYAIIQLYFPPEICKIA